MIVHRCLGDPRAGLPGARHADICMCACSRTAGCTLVPQPDRKWPTTRFEAATGTQWWLASPRSTGFAELVRSAAPLRRPPRQCGDTDRGFG
jgi:hypothetical protein